MTEKCPKCGAPANRTGPEKYGRIEPDGSPLREYRYVPPLSTGANHMWSETTTELFERIERAAALVQGLDLSHADVSRLAAALWHLGVLP